MVKVGTTPERFMFHKPNHNRVIYIKHAFTDDTMAGDVGWSVGTKLYFSYIKKSAYQGGQSIFVKDKTLRTALQFHTGIQVEDSSKDISRDLALLRGLENKPSLDPFLRKDRLHADGLKVHDAYLEITDGEFIEIRDSVISRFRPMVEMAFDSLEQADTLSQLRKVVEKIWETKDMDSQAPTLQADVIFG